MWLSNDVGSLYFWKFIKSLQQLSFEMRRFGQKFFLTLEILFVFFSFSGRWVLVGNKHRITLVLRGVRVVLFRINSHQKTEWESLLASNLVGNGNISFVFLAFLTQIPSLCPLILTHKAPPIICTRRQFKFFPLFQKLKISHYISWESSAGNFRKLGMMLKILSSAADVIGVLRFNCNNVYSAIGFYLSSQKCSTHSLWTFLKNI